VGLWISFLIAAVSSETVVANEPNSPFETVTVVCSVVTAVALSVLPDFCAVARHSALSRAAVLAGRLLRFLQLRILVGQAWS